MLDVVPEAQNDVVSTRAQEVLRHALELSTEERADVVAESLVSLDEPESEGAEIEAAWAAEIERRARRVLSGESTGIPWDEVKRFPFP